MEYIGYEVKLNLFKGILLGVMEETFIEEDVIEKDFSIYFGMLSICFTRIYKKRFIVKYNFFKTNIHFTFSHEFPKKLFSSN